MAAKKKVSSKKAIAKKAPKTTKTASFESVDKGRTKSQILSTIAEHTSIAKKDVAAIFDCLSELIGHDLKKGPGSFTVPGLVKVLSVKKPATKARKGVNPFTGEETTFKAKPARSVVKVRPLKGLKDKI